MQLAAYSRRMARALASAMGIGLLLTVGVGAPPLLPVALAGASTIAVRAARGLPIDPIDDALAGIRSDTLRVGTLTMVIAGCAAGPAWVAAVGLADADGIGAGIRVGLLIALVLAIPVVVVGGVLAGATTTPTRQLALAAVALVSANARSSGLIAIALLGAMLPIRSSAAPALLPMTLGVAYLVAARLAWRMVERSA